MPFVDSLVASAVFLRQFSLLLAKCLYIVVKATLLSLLPKKKKPLRTEVVLITGAARGLGRQLAVQSALLGCTVVLWDIDERKVKEVAEEIRKNGGDARWYCCDVTSEDDVQSKAQMVQQEVGDVNLLINNAGLMQNVPLLELDSHKIRKTLEVNVLAHFWTIRAFLPRMMATRKGHITAISSAAGLMGHVNQSDYSASKFAVIGLMESLAEEMRLADCNILLTTVCPLTVDTGLNRHPVSKYPSMAPILSIEEAATEVLNAIRMEEFLVSIPRRVAWQLRFSKLLPRRITSEVMDFLEYCRVPNSVPVTENLTGNLHIS